MSEPTQPDETARPETAARLETLATYRRVREGGAVPLVAIADVRRSFADSLCEALVATGAVADYWLVRYRVAADYTRRLTARPWPLTP
jgi:hypothetical protein